jgi:hypothetical protein
MTDDRIRAVYLGRVNIKGGKVGDSWVPEATLDALSEAEGAVLDRVASAFTPSRGARPFIGGVYLVGGALEGDRLTRLSASRSYAGASEHPLIARAKAADMALGQTLAEAKAEAEAKKAAEPLAEHIDALALVAARLPWSQRGPFIRSLGNEIDRRAMRVRK